MIVAEIRPEQSTTHLASMVGQQMSTEEILECIRLPSSNKKFSPGSTQLFAGEFRVMSETEETYNVAIVINEALQRFVISSGGSHFFFPLFLLFIIH